MTDFKKQIEEDIIEYAEKYSNITNIDKPEWAFNFWVLDKLFSIDEALIEEKIIDYNDKGIDCYVWHEDMHDLYLIQNKYYSEGDNLTVDYVMNDFLTRAIGALEKGTYTRSPELQKIYDKYHMEEDFHIYFYLYVTNNSSKTQKITDAIAKYNQQNASLKREAKFYSLDDIQQIYFEEPIVDKKSFSYTINTINKGTILKVNNDAYKMTQALDAKYVLTPVLTIFKMVEAAQKAHYQLFDDNVREFLGTTVNVNKKIKETLNDPKDRINFFFYNNGITMIVNDIGSERTTKTGREFDVSDPQIVNGCQTVSTIYDTLSSLPVGTLEQEFKDAYVMVKILKIPSNDASLKELYQNIVRYNNSQNTITEKSFTAKANVFRRLQTEFESKGLLVCIKQSDKYQFGKNYLASALIKMNKPFMKMFGLEDLSKVKDFMIDLEKLLQVFVAFESSPTVAVQNKSKLLKQEETLHNQVVDFIKNPMITSNDLLFLYLLYLRAEKEKKNSSDGKSPNPFYVIYCFSRYECLENPENISKKLETKEDVDSIIKKYKLTFTQYYKKWVAANKDKEYNDMIKSQIDNALLDEVKGMVEDILADA